MLNVYQNVKEAEWILSYYSSAKFYGMSLYTHISQ